ncbi:hypothetical protein HZA38_05425 [Candidatus Peregrinibacteria bacterium]|nr:hypothetical protein [Candidatus Peregrinibacteria bacterium]
MKRFLAALSIVSLVVFGSGCALLPKKNTSGDALIKLIEAERNLKKDVSLTLQTLSNTAETSEVEILLKNPSLQKIESVRAWVNFPPKIVEGKNIAFAENIVLAAPGEDTIDNENGIVKIGVSLDPQKNSASEISLGKITFSKKSSETVALSFFDARTDGHTFVLIEYNGDLRNILDTESLEPLMILGNTE